MSEEVKCEECKYSYKRAEFSYRTYGAYQCPYECIRTDRELYVKGNDSCEKGVKKCGE